MSINFSMSSVAVTIKELFESGQSASKICDLLKGRADRSGVHKLLKRLQETGSALPKTRSTPSRKVYGGERWAYVHFIRGAANYPIIYP